MAGFTVHRNTFTCDHTHGKVYIPEKIICHLASINPGALLGPTSDSHMWVGSSFAVESPNFGEQFDIDA